MVSIELMDKETLLTQCLHGGPIPVSKLGLGDTTMHSYLAEAVENYGSAAVLAIDDDKVVGLLRFYPQEVFDLLENHVCIQHKGTEYKFENTGSLPAEENLSDRFLRIECVQLVTGYYAQEETDYGGQGIGKMMIEKLVDWARENNWEKILYQGINPYLPLLQWTGLYPKDSLVSLGFEVETVGVSEPLKDGIINQISGQHGKEIKELWSQYGEVDVRKAAEVYNVAISLE